MAQNRLLCLLPDLNGGGAERVMLYIVRELARDRWDITLGLGRKAGPYVPLIPSDIRVREFGRDRAAFAVGDVASELRRGRYDLCFSMVSMNLAAILARTLSRAQVRIVISARNHYSTSMPAEASASGAKMRAIRLLYPRADLVICVSEGVRDDLESNFGVPPRMLRVIHNPIDIATVRELARIDPHDEWLPATSERPVLIAAGKLQVAKGYPHLLDAFRLVRASAPTARLLILGEGPERGWIENYIRQHDLRDQVRLLGFQQNPYQFLARATMFVHAALWEGFPNVLVEAMVCGLPVISTDCPSGPSEIVAAGRDGILVPLASPTALANAATSLLRDPSMAASLAAEATRTVDRFAIDRVIREYETAFLGLKGA